MSLHDKYESNQKPAAEFEDFVSDALYWRAGFPVHVNRSSKWQRQFGESRAGVEVKLDRQFRRTGNLFIETAERWNTDVEMRPAGIHGHGWLYAIGDFAQFWLFAFRTLRLIEGRHLHKETPTAKGFLLPLEKASQLAADIYNFPDPEGNARDHWFAEWRRLRAADPNYRLEVDGPWWDQWEQAMRDAPAF